MKRSILRLTAVLFAVLLALGTFAMAEGTTNESGLTVYDTPQSFTLWTGMGKMAGVVEDWSQNLVFQTMRDLTNVSIEFQHPAVGGEKDAFNLMCATGEYPDAIQYGWLTDAAGGPAYYIENEVIIPLNDLIDAYMPNLKAYLAAHPDLDRMCKLDDGTYYELPSIYEDVALATDQGPIIRGDFLDELGLTQDDLPTTLQGWEELLIQVRDNEKLNVIPFFFATLKNINDTNAIVGAWGIAQEFYNDNGTVKYGALQPEYKEFLELMRRWFDEGLIDPEFAANTDKMRDEKVTSDRVFMFLGSMGNAITRYTGMCRNENNPDFQLLPQPYPTIEEGTIAPIGRRGPLVSSGLAITTSCSKETAELICKYYDYFYTEEGHMLSNWGVQGMTYDYDENGNPYFLPLVVESEEGWSREQGMAKYTIWQTNSPVYKKNDELEQRDCLPEQIEGRKKWMECENAIIMPPVTPPAEEANEFATIMNDCTSYLYEQASKIIMGEVDLDEGYDVLVATLKGMGIDRAIELRQNALERYLARP